MKQESPPTGITRFIPGLALFKGLNPALIRTELVVAVTVFAVLVPSAMAYGDLAGVTPVAGLYVALAAMVMYALFGTSRQLITGPEATTAILVATAIGPLAAGDPVRYAALAAMVAILVGFVSILGGILKLGFITDFLSKPILVGYITGTSLIVIGSQLGKMVGIKVESDYFLRQVIEVLSRFDEWNVLTVALGIVAMAILAIIRRVNRALPGPLIVVALGIIASIVLDLTARGVAVVGAVPAGLPSLAIPRVSWQDILALLPAALALTVLIYADEILTARVFASKHGQKIDANQEFIAIGMANIGAGLLQGFPAATSGSRTTVADQMGGKSQLVGLIAAALTVIFLLFFTPLLEPLPTVVLGAIIIIATLGLIDIPAFRFLRKVRPAEAWLAVATILGVLALGVLQGILIAVVLSLINVIFHISRPHDALLDDVEAGGGVVYREVVDNDPVMTEPGLMVYRFDAPLVFANAAYFSQRVGELVAMAGEKLKCVVLDAEAISDFDSTAAEALENLDADLERLGIELWVARPNEPLRQMLHVTGLTQRLGKENIYPTVRAAVVAYKEQFPAP
ncbi:MAG: SulP family inorganic anion transporter [Chloroflexota bacterium]